MEDEEDILKGPIKGNMSKVSEWSVNMRCTSSYFVSFKIVEDVFEQAKELIEKN